MVAEGQGTEAALVDSPEILSAISSTSPSPINSKVVHKVASSHNHNIMDWVVWHQAFFMDIMDSNRYI